MEFIIDFQGFKSVTNEFIVKELALISVDAEVYELHLFQPPCNFIDLPRHLQKQVVWLESCHHGLFWGSGLRKYEELRDIFINIKIQGNVYVKGTEKQKFIASLLSDFDVKVINLEDFGCPKLGELKSKFNQLKLIKPCSFKHNAENCAWVNVHVLLEWWNLEKYIEQRLELVNIAIKECYRKGYANMSSELVKHLPREFLINHFENIEIIYDRLPEKLKSDVGIILNRRCFEHYPETGGDTFDGPNPKRKHCPFCLIRYQNQVQSIKYSDKEMKC